MQQGFYMIFIRKGKSILTILNNNYQLNPTIILGTFNCLQIRDYSNDVLTWLQNNNNNELDFHTIKFLEDNGFVDVFCGMPMSCWSGRREDFILVRNTSTIAHQCYYSSVSDHIPLFIDIDI